MADTGSIVLMVTLDDGSQLELRDAVQTPDDTLKTSWNQTPGGGVSIIKTEMVDQAPNGKVAVTTTKNYQPPNATKYIKNVQITVSRDDVTEPAMGQPLAVSNWSVFGLSSPAIGNGQPFVALGYAPEYPVTVVTTTSKRRSP